MKIKISFVGIGIIVLLTGYFIGNAKQTPSENDTSILKTAQNTADCPYKLPTGLTEEEVDKLKDYTNEVKVSEPPVIIRGGETVKQSEDFVVSEFEEGLYRLSNDKGWDSRGFDIDGDGQDEMIISANIAMNHTPHIAAIVDEGKIVFKAGGTNIWISEVGYNSGFLLQETIDWNTGEEKLTRYVYEDGGFKPVWEQKICWVEFKGE